MPIEGFESAEFEAKLKDSFAYYIPTIAMVKLTPPQERLVSPILYDLVGGGLAVCTVRQNPCYRGKRWALLRDLARQHDPDFPDLEYLLSAILHPTFLLCDRRGCGIEIMSHDLSERENLRGLIHRLRELNSIPGDFPIYFRS